VFEEIRPSELDVRFERCSIEKPILDGLILLKAINLLRRIAPPFFSHRLKSKLQRQLQNYLTKTVRSGGIAFDALEQGKFVLYSWSLASTIGIEGAGC
jgi:hypothetical protein